MPLAKSYIQYGVPSNWANEYERIGISVSTFRKTSIKNLLYKYKVPKDHIHFVKNSLKRKPIPIDTIQLLLESSRYVCCLCKGLKSDAYIIHHINEYSKTKDNSYSNLAVLCPNDHDLAHRTGISLTNKISVQHIKESKRNWEEQVKREVRLMASKSLLSLDQHDEFQQNPFKELQFFTEKDKEFYFGRKVELKDIKALIFKYNIVGLFGESGTGKTSLINAGLIPSFKEENIIPVSVRCLDNPIKRLREELFRVLVENKINRQSIEDLAIIDSFPNLLIQINTFLSVEKRSLVIIIDQFEELFTRSTERDKELFAKGISEALIKIPSRGNLYFLISLREDYIGDLWDWAHMYNLEDAWIHQYRIKRLNEEKAFEAIVEPLNILKINTNKSFILKIIDELKDIGDGLIYPPYLQIVCARLFSEYINKNPRPSNKDIFDFDLYEGLQNSEAIIADYLGETMLEGLTSEEKLIAQNILDLLTGPEGLRTFLGIEEISRFLDIKTEYIQHVVEHLIKKKIIHSIVEEDSVKGYELIHDFLSKRFFDKLGPEAKKVKTITEIFRKAFREWKQHEVLASKDILEILFPSIQQINLNDEEWTFLIKSSMSVYWSFENNWINLIPPKRIVDICLVLINDKRERIVEQSISILGKLKGKEITSKLIGLIESEQTSDSIKAISIQQFSFNIVDIRIIKVLKNIIINDKNYKLRKEAIYALARNLKALEKYENNIIPDEIGIFFDALNDPKADVRKQV